MSELILPAQAKQPTKPKKPMNIVDEMFAGESKEARRRYDDMVAKFRETTPDYVIPDNEAIYHKTQIHRQLMNPDHNLIRANFGAQTKFLLDDSRICIYGGAAGGGKTHAGLLYPTMGITVPNFRAVMFRRTMPEITDGNGLLDKSRGIYPLIGGLIDNGTYKWTFKNGSPLNARIDLKGMQYEKDADSHRGAEYGLVYFDELNMFTEYQFWFLFGRNRTSKEGPTGCPIKPLMRGSTNPDPDSFVRHLLDWYIGKDGLAIPERAGVKRWICSNHHTNIKEQFTDFEEAVARMKEIHPNRPPHLLPKPISLSFIPSELKDNPYLDEDYVDTLGSLDAVQMARLLDGNWNSKYAAGKQFNEQWVESIDMDEVPDNIIEVRGWDVAGTAPTAKNKNPDWTSGTKIGRVRGDDTCYVLDNQVFQLDPNDVKQRIKEIAEADGRMCVQDLPQDPGAGGKLLIEILREALPREIRLVSTPEVGKKYDRFAPFSALCFQGCDHGRTWVDKDGNTQKHVPIKKVKVVRAAWNTHFFDQLKQFPDGKNDDIADSVSRAFNNLFPAKKRPNIRGWLNLDKTRY